MYIPCKITLLGDKDYAKNFIGAAQSQLNILKNAMNFQKLRQGVRRTQLNQRIMVEANVCFNLSEVKIYCPFIGEKRAKGFVGECFCCCCWAMGFILGYTEGCSDCEIRYDVKVCQGNRYSLFQGCIPTDFAHYQIDEQVFVMVANSNTDGPGYTYREDVDDLFVLEGMIPSMLFSFDEYKTSAEKNDFEKCEECERKQECKDETMQHCKTTEDDETEESDVACMTETITIIPKQHEHDEMVREPRNCEEYQFEIGSACGVSRGSIIPPFYIVPIGCEEELDKWM